GAQEIDIVRSGLEEIMVQSEYGVTLVPGSSGSSALARLTRLQLLGLIHALSALDDCDYLVVDTAAGISDNVTVLFGACDIKLLLIQNEPSSIADAYATVKVLQQEFNLHTKGSGSAKLGEAGATGDSPCSRK
ncbi:MAG: hypothetical protein VW664_09495, partial [Halieaceae bacterium]